MEGSDVLDKLQALDAGSDTVNRLKKEQEQKAAEDPNNQKGKSFNAAEVLAAQGLGGKEVTVDENAENFGKEGSKQEEKSSIARYIKNRPLEDVFNEFDTDGSGLLDLDEFTAMLPKLGIKVSEAKALKYFRMCDADNSGEIDLTEFKVALYTIDPTKGNTVGFKPKDILSPEDAFKMFDEDQSGKLDEDEFALCLEYMGLDVSDAKQEALFKKYDKDRSGTIEYDEFKTVWLQVSDPRKELAKRGIEVGQYESKFVLQRKLQEIVAKEEDEEAHAMALAEKFREHELDMVERREALEKASERRDEELANALDIGGQVYVFGLGASNQFEGTAEKMYPDFGFFDVVQRIWNQRVHPKVKPKKILTGKEARGELPDFDDDEEEDDDDESRASSGEEDSDDYDSDESDGEDYVMTAAQRRKRKAQLEKQRKLEEELEEQRKKEQEEQERLNKLEASPFMGLTVASSTCGLWCRGVIQAEIGENTAFALTKHGEILCWGGRNKWFGVGGLQASSVGNQDEEKKTGGDLTARSRTLLAWESPFGKMESKLEAIEDAPSSETKSKSKSKRPMIKNEPTEKTIKEGEEKEEKDGGNDIEKKGENKDEQGEEGSQNNENAVGEEEDDEESLMTREERLQYMLNDFIVGNKKVDQEKLDEISAENYKVVSMYLDVWIPPPIRSERLSFMEDNLLPKIDFFTIKTMLELRKKATQNKNKIELIKMLRDDLDFEHSMIEEAEVEQLKQISLEIVQCISTKKAAKEKLLRQQFAQIWDPLFDEQEHYKEEREKEEKQLEDDVENLLDEKWMAFIKKRMDALRIDKERENAADSRGNKKRKRKTKRKNRSKSQKVKQNEVIDIPVAGFTSRAPQRIVHMNKNAAVRCISVGAFHVGAVHQTGQLYSWGDGNFGRLGLPMKNTYMNTVNDKLGARKLRYVAREDRQKPTKVDALANKNVVQLSCGYSHSGAIDSQGQLYTWGSGVSGKLGLCEITEEFECYCPEPTLVKLPGKRRLLKIACGNSHSAAITISGELFVWG
eukprot:g646.t1